MRKKRPEVASVMPIVLLVTGIIFIVGAMTIGFLIECPTRFQCFLVYTVVGIGMAGIFLKSAAQTSFGYNGEKLSLRVVGCIAVPFLLYVINPIDRIKGNGCEPPVQQIVVEPIPQAPVGLISKQPEPEKPHKTTDGEINKPRIPSKPKVDDTVIRKTTVQCNGLTKAGSQCKHYTHNINGYCNQHQPE